MKHFEDLKSVAERIVSRGKGILAIDESIPTIKKRFDSVGIGSTAEMRRSYRDLLITVPGGGEYLSGVILFDETIRQSTREKKPFTEVLAEQGILPGIKVDCGAKELALCHDERVTEGLDGLRERLAEYYKLGARFAKWRAVITIGDGLPSKTCVRTNIHALARYAALCQEENLVPMVEPEVLMDGNHSVERCYEVISDVLQRLFRELRLHGVAVSCTVLKTSMVTAGNQCEQQASIEDVADMTVRCLLESAPAALAGIVFLSGGQSPEAATAHLGMMNQRHPHLPWPLSFSYGRALQAPCLKEWAGRDENRRTAAQLLLHRERCNSFAALGKYHPEMETR